MPSPQDRQSPPPHHRMIDAATVPLRWQRPPGPVRHSGLEAPSPPSGTAARPPQPPGRPWQPPAPHGVHAPADVPFRDHPQMPIEQQAAPGPVIVAPARITTTQRPHRRVDTSVLYAAAALILLGVAVLVGIAL